MKKSPNEITRLDIRGMKLHELREFINYLNITMQREIFFNKITTIEIFDKTLCIFKIEHSLNDIKILGCFGESALELVRNELIPAESIEIFMNVNASSMISVSKAQDLIIHVWEHLSNRDCKIENDKISLKGE